MILIEVWKIIEEYPNYQVSNLGRIKSFKQDKIYGKILKQCKNDTEYFCIKLYKNGKNKTKLVHRLVYETFKEKLEDGYDAHHINENKEDNFVENLESKQHEKHSKDHNVNKKLSKEIKTKISKSHIGKKHSEETKTKMSKNNFNKINKINTSIIKERVCGDNF